MNGRREASRWSGSPILPYGFGVCACVPVCGPSHAPPRHGAWSASTISPSHAHALALLAHHTTALTMSDVCSRVFRSSSGVLCTPGRAHGVFLPGVFLPIADRVTRAQRSFEHRYRSATGARGSRVCSVLLRLPRLAGLDGCEVRPCVFHVCARVSRVGPGSPESYFYRYCTSVRFLPKGAGGGFISGFVPYPHNTLIPN